MPLLQSEFIAWVNNFVPRKHESEDFENNAYI